MILLIDTCSEPLSSREFVRPIREALEAGGARCMTRHYLKTTAAVVKKADKIIICGNALKDQDALSQAKRFAWLRECDKPVLAICAGMQVLCAVFGARVENALAIGVHDVAFTLNDAVFGTARETKVYLLHTKRPALPAGFEMVAQSEGHPVAIRRKNLRAVLFHPEVLNKEVLMAFARRES